MWPFKKKNTGTKSSSTSEGKDSSPEDLLVGDDHKVRTEEPCVSMEKYIKILKNMQCMHSFNFSPGDTVYIRDPETLSLLITTVKEVFIGIRSSYLTVSDSLQNLSTGGGYFPLGIQHRVLRGSTRIFFDPAENTFYFWDNGYDKNGKRQKISLEKDTEEAQKNYEEYLAQVIERLKQDLNAQN